MSRDGFATLTAGMMMRRHDLPFAADGASGRAHHAQSHQTLREAPPMPGPDPRRTIDGLVDRRVETRPEAPQERREVPEEDRAHYNGPERRQRDVSPVVERRGSVPPRVKTSIRLEQHRYVRLRLASNVLARTHQDLMISAIDAYLDSLHVPRFDPRKRYLK